jgi:hypothetical protein
MTPKMISTCEQHILSAAIGAVYFSNTDIPGDVSNHVRFFVLPSTETLPIGIGFDAKKRNIGIVQATVCGPRGRGAGAAGAVAHTIWKHFTRMNLEVLEEGWITFKEGSVVDRGEINQEHMVIVRIPYYYDFKISD